jgi:amidase
MKRRSFLKNGLATGTVLSIGACNSIDKEKAIEASQPDQFPLNEKSISEISAAYKAGDLTCAEVTKLYLDRIEQIDKNGPKLNSVIEINTDAMEIARMMDAELQKGNSRGPLHGIPILLKDNINTKGKMLTTAGSLALEGNYCTKNSWVAQKLEDAGALILGKTNLSEWANFRSTRSSSGWSGRGGQTRNPYITDRNPCGSSSGSGVAASANLCSAAIGTETNGSVVCPSSTNGIVGIKPTVGLVSRSGIIPIAHSYDTAGPMTRTVADAALVLGTMTGIDPTDKYTSNSKSQGDYSKFLIADALSGKKLGLAKRFTEFHSEVDKLLDQAVKDFETLGASVVTIDNDELDGKSGGDAYDVMLYEFKNDLNSYLEKCPPEVKVRSLEELIKFNSEHASMEMPFFDQEILEAAQAKGSLDSAEYQEAVANVFKSNGPEGIDRVMDKYSIDAIIAPTGAPSWPLDVINGDHFMGGSSSPAARSGYPNITVPMGFIHGLPVGLSIFAEAFSESKLISFAYAFEQATQHRKAPSFLPTFDFSLNK